MDAYGIYLSTPDTQQSVAVGGDVTYQMLVRNSSIFDKITFLKIFMFKSKIFKNVGKSYNNL